ncbi:MAG: rhodanese-like domain-containing protein [Pyrinomonadaceae bacterium MAG19_C2-C3]|nr:rhodanese-like domain-containing protein [Pyrinomonadaceae bacterium MAG19_C2-C3]
MNYQTIEPAQLAARLANGEPLRVIDVREQIEHDIAHLEQAELMPLSRFQEWTDTLDPSQEIVFLCHHGIRSAQVCNALARVGFTKLHNLSGGIDAWSKEVDGRVPRY